MDSVALAGIQRRMLAYWFLFGLFAAGAMWFALNSGRAPAPVIGNSGSANAPASPRRRHRWLEACAAFAILLIGMRFQVGTDWNSYVAIYQRFSGADLFRALASSDPAYAWLNWAAGQLGADIWAVNLACALLFMFGLMRFA